MQRNHVRVLILVLLLGLGLWAPVYAALPSTTVWEVRPTVGSDNSGGCFDSAGTGTDFTQQNAAQFSGTDLASVSALVVSSTSHNFVATDVGNCIHITAGTGFTAGFYEIVSVATNQATLDRSPGTVGTGGTWAEGGALATPATVNANATASNHAWVKATGTYTVTTAMTITLDSHNAPATPYTFSGYTTTRGDGGQFTWTTATNSVDLVDFTQAQNVRFENIIFTSTAGTPGDGLQAKTTGNSLDVSLYNCKISGFAVGIEGNFQVNWSFVGLYFINSRMTANVIGIRNSGTTYVFGSMLDNNTSDAMVWSGGSVLLNSSWKISRSVVYKNGGNGFNNAQTAPNSLSDGISVMENNDFSTNTLAGVLYTNNTNINTLMNNNVFDANGTFGVDGSAGSTTVEALGNSNAFFNNTSGATRNINAGIGTITLTANPYTAIGSNFLPNSTAGGGAALKGAAFPGVIPGAGTGTMDVGALQTSGGGGGGGGPVAYAIIQ